MWDKELEARKIIQKELEPHQLFIVHKDGRPPTPYTKIGYCKESVMQSDFYQWACNSYLQKLGKTLAHVPNEGDTAGQAGAIKGGLRKAMGVLPGFPDFICVANWPQIDFAELKLPGEVLSKNQQNLHDKWSDLGISIPIISEFVTWRLWIEKIVFKGTF